MAKLEKRYYVLKITDMEKYLSPEERAQIEALCLKMRQGREKDGRPQLESVVIENDWPEYRETVAKVLYRARSSAVYSPGVVPQCLPPGAAD